MDLIRDQGHKYFLSVLQDHTVTADYRTLSAFVLACIVHNFPFGQAAALQGSLISMCLIQCYDTNWILRQWLALCLGQLWQNYDKARWSGVRDLAHEKLYPLLKDPVPEVRAAAVFALGTFISSVSQRSEHANNIDRSIAMTLWNTCANDMSPIVRMELLSALQWMVILFENQFVTVVRQDPRTIGQTVNTGNQGTLSLERKNIKRVSSSNCIVNIVNIGTNALSIYTRLWIGLQLLTRDPYPGVAKMATKLVDYIRNQAIDFTVAKDAMSEKSSLSLPPSPNTRINYLSGDSPPKHHHHSDLNGIQNKSPAAFTPPKCNSPGPGVVPQGRRVSTSRMYDSGSEECSKNPTEQLSMKPLITTNYFDWAVSQFARPSKLSDDTVLDRDSIEYLSKMEIFKRNAQMRFDARAQYHRVIFGRLDNQVWCGRTHSTPCIVKLHPYENQIAVAYKDRVMLRDWIQNRVTSFTPPKNDKHCSSSVSSIEFINAHIYGMILVGYEDGYVRLWRPSTNANEEPTFVTGWLGLFDSAPNKVFNKLSRNSGNGFVTAWHQSSQTLFTGGDSRVINMWDAEKELKSGEMQVGSDSSIRVMSIAPNGLLAAGCGDGSVKIFDKRLSGQTAVVITYREHTDSILSACMRYDCESFISGW